MWLPILGFVCALVFTLFLIINKNPIVFGLCFVILFLGLMYSHALSHQNLPPEGKYKVQATLSGMPEGRAEDKRIKAQLIDLELFDEEGRVYKSKSAYWTFYPSSDMTLPQDGEQIQMTSTLYHPIGRQNPFGFDFRMYLLQKGINIGLSGAKDLQINTSFVNTSINPWLSARMWLASLYDNALEGDSELIKTLLWGDRSSLADEVKQDFRDAGIMHVLSVSGLHVSILSLALYFLLNFVGIPGKLRFWIMAIFLTLYCSLLGFNAPVFRSALMSLIILSAALYHQRSDPLTGLAAAFILILTVRPLDLFNAGFQLSFLAVLGIFTLGDQMQSMYMRSRKGKRSKPQIDKVVYAFQTTLAASIFTAPIVVSVFHRFSFVGLLFSPLACLAVSILMIYGLIILPFAAIWMPLAKIMAIPLGWFISIFTKVTSAVANLPFASIQLAAPGLFIIILLLLMLIVCTRYLNIAVRSKKILFSIALIAAVSLNVSWKTEDVRYILFSSGNADAAVIEDSGATFVIDAAEHGGDLGNYLLSRGRAVDQLFISHLHRDHIGGLQQLVDQGVDIKELVLSQHALETNTADGSIEILQYALSRGIPLRYASRGDEFDSDRVNIKVLWPIIDKMYPNMDPNHNSMVLMVNLNGVSMLTAGDLTGDYEHYSAQSAQVLKLAHHGSKSSTSTEYLLTVSPQLALLSANSQRLPFASAVMSRLNDRGIPLWGTQNGQAIIMTVKDNGESTIEHYCDRGMR